MQQHRVRCALLLLASLQLCAAASNAYYSEKKASRLADATYLHPLHARRLGASGGASRSLLADGSLGDSEVKVSELGLDSLQSQVECKAADVGAAPDPVLCTYKNLLIWDGNLHFIGPAPAVHEWSLTKLQQGGAKMMSSGSQVGAPADAAAVRSELGGLITPAQYHNYKSVFGLTLPTVHGVLCKHFERCGHEPDRRPQLLLTNTETLRDGAERVIRGDWTSCLSKSPVVARNASSLAGRLLVMDTAFMLFESACVSGGGECKPWDYRSAPGREEVMTPWRNRLAACLGTFDIAKHAPQGRLQMLLVDRDYWSGRKILNVNELVRNLVDRYPAANVTVLYPERLSLADQARAYNDATTIMWVTGASIANLIFAPHGAVVMHIGMKEAPLQPYSDVDQWVDKVVPTNLEIAHMVNKNPDRIILRSYWVYKNPEYEGLTDEEKLGVWELKLCPGKEGEHVNTVCENIWIAKGGEFEMEFGFLWEAMDKFMPAVLDRMAKAVGASST